MPAPPSTDVIALHDDTPDEVESRAELDRRFSAGTLSGLITQGLRLDDQDAVAALSTVDVHMDGVAEAVALLTAAR